MDQEVVEDAGSAVAPPARLGVERATELVFGALGAASTCWSDMRGAGVFDDRRARQVGLDLLTALGYDVAVEQVEGQPEPVERTEDLAAPQRVRGRPGYIQGDAAVICDWLAANGIREWVPENLSVHVDTSGDPLLTYTSHLWRGERGWDGGNIAVRGEGEDRLTEVELRTVPLLMPPDDAVRAAFRNQGLVLSGDGGNTWCSEPDRRCNVTGRLLEVVSGYGGETILAGPVTQRMVEELSDAAEALARDGYLPAARAIPRRAEDDGGQ